MSRDTARQKSKGRGATFLLGALVVGAAVGVRNHAPSRRMANRAIEHGRAWSNRQLNRALQAPVIKSQGERWRAMHEED
jgi:hypothetical protein